MNFAVIKNDKVIAVVGIFPTNYYQFDAIIPTDKPVVVGDTYIDGEFYHEGVEILDNNETNLGIISGEIPIESEEQTND